jgi:UDP-N-acetylglucosamine 2-epimerase
MSDTIYAKKEEVLLLKNEMEKVISSLDNRMENIEKSLDNICQTLKTIAEKFPSKENLELSVLKHKSDCEKEWDCKIKKIIDSDIGNNTKNLLWKIVSSIAIAGALLWIGLTK